jgi:mono/diheme cytochrome c family protein
VDVGVLVFSGLGAWLGLDRITGAGVGAADGSTGGVAELIMWACWTVGLTSAGMAGVVGQGKSALKLARIGLGAGALALFFGAAAATIRTGAGVSQVMMLAMTCAVFLGLLVLLVLGMAELAGQAKAKGLGRAAGWLSLVLAGVVVGVGWLGRSDYGGSRLTGRGQVINKVEDPLQIASVVALDYDARELEMGRAVFMRSCAQCHAVDFRVVGPPVTEIAAGYLKDPGQMAAWIKNPGKRREEYPQMARVVLTEDRYQAVSKFVVALARTEALKRETKSQEGRE